MYLFSSLEKAIDPQLVFSELYLDENSSLITIRKILTSSGYFQFRLDLSVNSAQVKTRSRQLGPRGRVIQDNSAPEKDM